MSTHYQQFYPTPASEKRAEDFLFDCLLRPPTGLLPPAHEQGVQDDLYHMVRYGVAEYDPATKLIRLTRDLSKEEFRAFWQHIDAENP